jgi:hypothetical protein
MPRAFFVIIFVILATMNFSSLLLLVTLSLSPEKENLISDGYVSSMSVKAGDSLTVYINSFERKEGYTLKLYNLKGDVVAKFQAVIFPQERTKDEPWKNGFGYKPTLKIKVPNLKSGVYLWDDQIPFVIRASKPKIVVVYSSNTENAYCNAGGKSLYAFNSSDKKPASIVSFLRPIPLPKHSEAFLKWFCKQGFQDVGYIADADLDNYSEFKHAKLLLIVGHSEYWSLKGRTNFDRYVNEGNNALILSGNTMWWQARYDKSNNQLICYRSLSDPEESNCLKTVTWDNPLLGYPIINSIGVDFPHAGYGQKADKGWDGYKIVNPQSPLLKGLRLRKGDIVSLPSDEYDGTAIVGFDGKNAPVVNKDFLGFEKAEIIGYDSAFGTKEGLATWVVFKKSKKSGIVVNTASTDWCSQRGMNSSEIKKITLTMIQLLLKKENVFSTRTN